MNGRGRERYRKEKKRVCIQIQREKQRNIGKERQKAIHGDRARRT